MRGKEKTVGRRRRRKNRSRDDASVVGRVWEANEILFEAIRGNHFLFIPFSVE